jgi:hypothetical protein
LAEILNGRSKTHEHTSQLAVPLGVLASNERVRGMLDGPHIHINASGDRSKTAILRAALGAMDIHGEGQEGESIVRTVDFEDEEVGVARCVKTQPDSCIVYLTQNGKKEPTRFVLGVEPVPTTKVTAVLKRETNNPKKVWLLAAYPGEHVEPEPHGRFRGLWRSKQFWESHAFVLDDLRGIDLSYPPYLGHVAKKNEITIKVLQDIFEQKERELLVGQTIAHMATSSFIPNYISLQTEA